MADEKIRALTTKRAGAKRSLTAYLNFLNKFNPESDVLILEKRFSEIEEVRNKFFAYQEELEELLEESDALFAHRDEFENTYFNAFGIATKLLAQYSKKDTTPPITTDQINNSSTDLLNSTIQSQVDTPILNTESNNAQQQGQQGVNNNNATSHLGSLQNLDAINQQHLLSQLSQNALDNFHSSSLPTIQLPTFSGAYDTWLGFHDLFNSLVHKDLKIPPVKKLFYLKGCLKGEAADIISTIESSDENYIVAWDLLKERYDDRKYIRDYHIKTLVDMPSISKDHSFRAFLDRVQKHLRALQALGEPIGSWDSILIVILREKLNSSARERWEDCSSGMARPTVNNLIDFLKRRAQVEGIRIQTLKPASERPNTNNRSNTRSQHTFSATTQEHSCVFCGENNHLVYSCSQFAALDPHARYEASRSGGWCTNCLKKGHRASKCISQSCRNCKQKHHTLLHFEKSNNFSNQSMKPQVSAHFVANSTILQAQVSSHVLLATALVDMVNHQGKSKTIRVFLDAGSQAHFITENIANFLNLIKKPANI